jgi:hypothetical protein
MQITAITKIITARRQGDRSYLLVFATDEGVFEVFLCGSGFPGAFGGYMAPSLRNQNTGESRVLQWDQAELLAEHLETVLGSAGVEKAVAQENIDALKSGRRYGSDAV